MKKILAKKIAMTQVWRGDAVTPVTVLSCDDTQREFLAEIKEGDRVTVSGISKGRGFQGVVKRHGFHGGPKTHGQKNRLRAPGSIGPTAPQRVIKGRKMAGHMGMERVTVRRLLVAQIEQEAGKILIRGAVPGARGGKVEIRIPD